ncbi:MAG: VanW family protein [Oscillospiraceae bacterium]|nr:VanW family protein [Oscillospiraceae bacterium]
MSEWKHILEHRPDDNREKRKFETTEVNVVKPKNKPYFGLSPMMFWATVGAVALCVIIAIVWVALLAVQVRDYDRIYPGVSVFDIDVGGMTLEEARDVIEEYGDNYFSGKQLRLVCGEDNIVLNVKNAMTSIDADYIAGLAYSYGKSEGLFAQVRLMNKEEPHPLDVNEGFTINERYVNLKIEELAAIVEKDFVNYKVTNTGESLEITRGQDGLTVNRTEIEEAVGIALTTGVFDDIIVETSVQKAVPPDIDYLRGTVYVAPQNAYIERTGTKSYIVRDEVVGVDIDTEQMKADMEKDDWDCKVYDFIYTEPVSVSELKEILFMDTLATYTTDLSSSGEGRTTNVKLAAAEINGAVLLPGGNGKEGEEFSFNNIVGERSEALGYQNAIVFANGEMVDGVGGGICQVSSTIYVAALLADLEITERHSHVFSVSYVPLGQDATVQWGFLDFKFRNNSGYPIKIMAEVIGSELKVTILGTITDPEKSLVLESVKTGEIDFETEYRQNNSLPTGTYLLKQRGQLGYTCEVYKNVYRSGVLVDRVLVNNTKYDAASRIIEANPVP